MDNFFGLDLGKYTDFAALSGITRQLAIDEETGLPLRESSGSPKYLWAVRALRRWPLKTPYTTVVSDLVKIANRPDINPKPSIVVDATGVGTAVFEQVKGALYSYKDIKVYGISITSGEGWKPRGFNFFGVSKVQLTSALAEALGCGRIKVCERSDGKAIDNWETLSRELEAFKVRETAASNLTFQAINSDHDDCVVALALVVWLSSQRFCQMKTQADVENRRGFLTPREAAAMSAHAAQQKAAFQAELDALERERQQAAEREEAERALSWRGGKQKASWEAAERSDEERERDPFDPQWWGD